jgi:uncharacterized membrane protein
MCLNSLQLGQISVISLFFFLDIMATYFFMVKYRRTFPKEKNWSSMELNWIMRNCWKKWGLHKGTLISALIIYPLVFAVAYFITDRFLIGIMVGLYMMVFVSHIMNFRIFSMIKKKKQEKNGKKVH